VWGHVMMLMYRVGDTLSYAHLHLLKAVYGLLKEESGRLKLKTEFAATSKCTF